MKWMSVWLLGVIGLTLALIWFMSRVRYRITPRHFQITLFGLRLRRIPLQQIRSVGKRRPRGWAEKWHNTIRPTHRLLVIRRSKGLFRNIVITPRNRYVFKADLEQAIAELEAPSEKGRRHSVIISD